MCLPDDLVPSPRDVKGESCLSPMSTGNKGQLEAISARWYDRDGSLKLNSHQKVWEKKGFKTTRGLGFSFEEDDFPEPPEFGGDGDEADKIMRSGLAFQIEAPGQAGRQIHSRASDGPGDPSPAKRFLYIKLESAGTDGVGEMIEHSLDYLRTRCYFGTKGDCVIPATLDEPAPCPMQGLEKNGRKEKYWGPLGKTVPGSQDRVKMCSDPGKYLQRSLSSRASRVIGSTGCGTKRKKTTASGTGWAARSMFRWWTNTWAPG